MFKKIIRELAGIRVNLDALGKSVRNASETLRALSVDGDDGGRLSALEGRIEAVAGQVEAGLIKGEALKATARAAEDRARGHMKRAEGYAKLAESLEGGEDEDPFEAAARAYSELPDGNGEIDPGEMPSVSSHLEGRRARRAVARNAKRR